jgi:hypothetical protein
MSALYDVTCGCEACGTRWETTGIPEWTGGLTTDEIELTGRWLLRRWECPHCGEDTYTVIISINNDAEGSHPSLTAGERQH